MKNPLGRTIKSIRKRAATTFKIRGHSTTKAAAATATTIVSPQVPSPPEADISVTLARMYTESRNWGSVFKDLPRLVARTIVVLPSGTVTPEFPEHVGAPDGTPSWWPALARIILALAACLEPERVATLTEILVAKGKSMVMTEVVAEDTVTATAAAADAAAATTESTAASSTTATTTTTMATKKPPSPTRLASMDSVIKPAFTTTAAQATAMAVGGDARTLVREVLSQCVGLDTPTALATQMVRQGVVMEGLMAAMASAGTAFTGCTDVKGERGWRVRIEISSPSPSPSSSNFAVDDKMVTVDHIRREACGALATRSTQGYEIEWVTRCVFDAKMEALRDGMVFVSAVDYAPDAPDDLRQRVAHDTRQLRALDPAGRPSK